MHSVCGWTRMLPAGRCRARIGPVRLRVVDFWMHTWAQFDALSLSPLRPTRCVSFATADRFGWPRHLRCLCAFVFPMFLSIALVLQVYYSRPYFVVDPGKRYLPHCHLVYNIRPRACCDPFTLVLTAA